MKELTVNEVKAVSGAFNFGCDFIKPSSFMTEGMAAGSMKGAGLGSGRYAPLTAKAMTRGGAVGAALGFAGLVGYTIGTAFNHAIGRCN